MKTLEDYCRERVHERRIAYQSQCQAIVACAIKMFTDNQLEALSGLEPYRIKSTVFKEQVNRIQKGAEQS